MFISFSLYLREYQYLSLTLILNSSIEMRNCVFSDLVKRMLVTDNYILSDVVGRHWKSVIVVFLSSKIFGIYIQPCKMFLSVPARSTILYNIALL